jgi:phospholipase/lecithinase/hemolysin
MRFHRQLARVATRFAAGLLVAAGLASCGGGTYQVKAFVPARLLSFGDENSLLVAPDGRKYSINGINTSTDLVDCQVAPMWFQVLATSYNMVYPECNPAGDLAPAAHSYAAVGATLDDVTAQVNAFVTSDNFAADDLVTLYVGTNDLLQIYATAFDGNQADILVQMHARGAQLGNLVNQIAGYGAKVLVLTIPDMADSPFAVKEQARGDFDRIALLSQMTDAFNRTMRSTIINDGSKIGLVLVDDFVHGVARSPYAFGLTSYNIAACLETAPLPGCTTDASDIVIDNSQNPPVASASAYLWADDTHLGIVAQTQIGNQAVTRAHSNPF